jgi:hypothetical protein
METALDNQGGEKITFPPFDFDKPETWASEEIYHYPDFNKESFQGLLDDLFGLSETGLPNVRLVWPGDIKKCYSKFYTTWTSSGFGVDTELRAKYKYASIQIPGTSDTIDIPPARWILEQFNHPGQYLASWEATRFDKEGREVRPAPPPHGYYSHLWTIARHNEQCCKEAIENKKVCWGNYRLPDDHDIKMLKEAKRARDADREIDTTKPLDDLTLKQIEREVVDLGEKNDKRNAALLDEFVDEHAYELIEYFIGVPCSDIARKKFSIPKELKGKYRIKKEKMEKADLILPYK